MTLKGGIDGEEFRPSLIRMRFFATRKCEQRDVSNKDLARTDRVQAQGYRQLECFAPIMAGTSSEFPLIVTAGRNSKSELARLLRSNSLRFARRRIIQTATLCRQR
jgi:hypothetical protein